MIGVEPGTFRNVLISADFYQSYSYDQWLGFLEAQFLVRNDAGLIGITVRGQEFLNHLIKDNLPKVKAG